MQKKLAFHWKLLWFVALFDFVFSTGGQFLVNYFSRTETLRNIINFSCLVVGLVFFSLLIFAIRKMSGITYHQSLEFLGLKKPNLDQVVVGLICSTPIILCDYLVYENWHTQGFQARLTPHWYIDLIFLFFYAGVFEEGLVRGFFFHYLRQKYSFLISATFSGILWVFFHCHLLFTKPFNNISFNENLIFFGLVLWFCSFSSAYVFERSGNAIWGWLIVHVIYDSSMVIGFYRSGEAVGMSGRISLVGLFFAGLFAFPVAHRLLKKSNEEEGVA